MIISNAEIEDDDSNNVESNADKNENHNYNMHKSPVTPCLFCSIKIIQHPSNDHITGRRIFKPQFILISL